MPRRKKPAHELTTEEVLKKMFPKPVREKIANEAKNVSEDGANRSTPRRSN
jgi:hypothetical protein